MLNVWMISEKLTGKDEEGAGHHLILNFYCSTQLEGLRENS